MPEPISIHTHDLSIGYRQRHSGCRVMEHIGVSAANATLTCVIGRNGAGKSTLLRTIARLQQPLGGHVDIGGRDAASYSRRELARLLSIVLTARPDTDNLTVGELVALGRAPYTGFWGRLSAADRDAAERAMHMTGILALRDRRVCSLSDGECQKAMIAKSLAQDTPVILLDEPTAFLDYPAKVELMTLLRRLAHDDGKTILLSTHDLETALQTTDRMWLLDGTAVVEGTPLQLAHSGAIARYIGRDDVALDTSTMCLRVTGVDLTIPANQ